MKRPLQRVELRGITALQEERIREAQRSGEKRLASPAADARRSFIRVLSGGHSHGAANTVDV